MDGYSPFAGGGESAGVGNGGGGAATAVNVNGGGGNNGNDGGPFGMSHGDYSNAAAGGGGTVEQQQQQQQRQQQRQYGGGTSPAVPPPRPAPQPAPAAPYDPLLGLVDMAGNVNGGGGGGGSGFGSSSFGDPFAAAAPPPPAGLYGGGAAGGGGGYTQMQPSQLGGGATGAAAGMYDPLTGNTTTTTTTTTAMAFGGGGIAAADGMGMWGGGGHHPQDNGITIDDSLQFLFGGNGGVGGTGHAAVPPPGGHVGGGGTGATNAGLGALGIGLGGGPGDVPPFMGGGGGGHAAPAPPPGAMNVAAAQQQQERRRQHHINSIHAMAQAQQARHRAMAQASARGGGVGRQSHGGAGKQRSRASRGSRKKGSSSQSAAAAAATAAAQQQAFASSMFDPIDVFSAPPPKPPMNAAISASRSAVPTRGTTPPPVTELENDEILCNFTMKIEHLSTESLTAAQVLDKVNKKTDEVITLFLPCVDFLVQCQQELRAGLATAMKKRYSHGRYQNSLTPRQFYSTYISPLPGRFFRQNQPIMPTSAIQSAYTGLEALCADAKRVEHSGCEAMKNAFLGGMREGQSWGLRKWLSKNGGALAICNDLELIMGALRKLDKSAPTTIRMAEIVRPRAQLVFDRLKADVPKAYQEHSSAHPYLPFFHRLEGVLKGLATFDPEDDDVVCLDDDSDVEEVKPTPVKSESSAGAGTSTATGAGTSSKRPSLSTKSDEDLSMKESTNAQGSTPKRIKREDSSVSALSGFDSAFGQVLAGLAEEKEEVNVGSLQSSQHDTSASGRSSSQENKPKAVTIDLLDSSDEEDDSKPAPARAGAPSGEEDMETSKPAAATHGPTAASAAAASTTAATSTGGTQTQSTSTSKGWRCPQCTFLNNAKSTTCIMCNDDDDGDFESDALLKALIDGTFANDLPGPSDTNMDGTVAQETDNTTQAHTTESLCTKLDVIIQAFGSNMHYMLRPVEVDTTSDHWNSEHNFVWCLKLFKMMIQKADAQAFLNPPDETEIFLAGLPPYSTVIKHPLSFGDIVVALADSNVPGSHLWGEGKLDSLPKCDLWQGKQLLEAIDMVILNALAYFGDRDKSKKSAAQKLRNYYWKTLDEKTGHNKAIMPKRRKPSDGFISRK